MSLSPKGFTITSNEKKKMIMSMEIRQSINICSSRLTFLFFEKIYVFVRKMRFLQPLKLIFVKKQTKFLLRV